MYISITSLLIQKTAYKHYYALYFTNNIYGHHSRLVCLLIYVRSLLYIFLLIHVRSLLYIFLQLHSTLSCACTIIYSASSLSTCEKFPVFCYKNAIMNNSLVHTAFHIFANISLGLIPRSLGFDLGLLGEIVNIYAEWLCVAKFFF